MVRFVHTADWQLGMTRHFLSEEAQARYSQARIDAIGRIGAVASKAGASFILVAGDVFEANQLSRQTILRSLEAIKAVGLPIVLVPGNHDPLDPVSIYRSKAFVENLPSNLTILDSNSPVTILEGVQLLGAPWPSKRPTRDLVAAAISAAEWDKDSVRIVVGHGALDRDAPDKNDPALISAAALEIATTRGGISYVALGDRHSATDAGIGGRVWYSGTPEPTDYDETDPGKILVVDLNASECKVTAEKVGTWRFEMKGFEVASDLDVAALGAYLDQHQEKQTTILKLRIKGTLGLRQMTELQTKLDDARQLFGALELADPDHLLVSPTDQDFEDLRLSGFARMTFDALKGLSNSKGGKTLTASDALNLLYRLAKGEPT